MTDGDQKNALLSAPGSSTSTASTTAPQPTTIAGGVVHGQQIPEATMAAAAIHNNERLFPQMLERLKDPSTYIDETRKLDRKSTRLNSSHSGESRMPSSA